MNLERYLERIGYRGNLSKTPDRSMLDQLMMTHVNAVTFENLNQQLGRPVTMDLENIFEKVVEERRGGWCFELNSLFAWALEQIGYDVQLLAGQVGRSEGDPAFLANHMLLRVELDQPLLVDVGFGCGLARSIPLQAGSQLQLPYDVSIETLSDGYMRYGEQERGAPQTYDFTLMPVNRNYFNKACDRLQTDPESPFLRTLTAQQRQGDQHIVLRGLVLRTVGREATQEFIFETKEQLVECLQQTFGLDVPEIAEIWPDLVLRHQALFGAD